MGFKLGVVLACLLNLAAGVAIGVGLDRACRFGPPHFGPPGPQALARLLDLTPEQETKVREVLERHRPEIDSVREEEHAKLSAMRDRIDAELKSILNPEQFAKLVAQRKEFEERERRLPGPPPRGR